MSNLFNIGIAVNVRDADGVFRPVMGVGPQINGNSIQLGYNGVHYFALLPIPCDEADRYPTHEVARIGHQAHNSEVQPLVDAARLAASRGATPYLPTRDRSQISLPVTGQNTGE